MHKRRSICSSSNTIGERTLRGRTSDGGAVDAHRLRLDFHPPPLPRQSERDARGTRVRSAQLPSEAAPLSSRGVASSVSQEGSAVESIAMIVGV